MSPVSTATRSLAEKASRVLSRSVVLPEPGELIRFRQSTPSWANRPRNWPAMRSFSLSTLRSSGTCLIVLHFQRYQLQFVPAHEFRLCLSALGARQAVIGDSKNVSTRRTALLPGAALDFKLQRLQAAVTHQHLKAKVERLRVHARHLAHPQLHHAHTGARMLLRLLLRLPQHRTRDAQLVHRASADARQLVASQHIHNACGAQRGAHGHQAGMLALHAPNNARFPAQTMTAHSLQ